MTTHIRFDESYQEWQLVDDETHEVLETAQTREELRTDTHDVPDRPPEGTRIRMTKGFRTVNGVEVGLSSGKILRHDGIMSQIRITEGPCKGGLLRAHHEEYVTEGDTDGLE